MPIGDGGPQLRLAELMGALSIATDLAVDQPMDRTLRASVLAVRLGDQLGLTEPELSETYYLTLLRMVGCTGDARLLAEAFGDDLRTYGWMSPVYGGQPNQMLLALFQNVG